MCSPYHPHRCWPFYKAENKRTKKQLQRRILDKRQANSPSAVGNMYIPVGKITRVISRVAHLNFSQGRITAKPDSGRHERRNAWKATYITSQLWNYSDKYNRNMKSHYVFIVSGLVLPWRVAYVNIEQTYPVMILLPQLTNELRWNPAVIRVNAMK